MTFKTTVKHSVDVDTVVSLDLKLTNTVILDKLIFNKFFPSFVVHLLIVCWAQRVPISGKCGVIPQHFSNTLLQ